MNGSELESPIPGVTMEVISGKNAGGQLRSFVFVGDHC